MNEIEIQFDKGVMLFTHHSKYFNGLVIERFDNNQIKLKIDEIDGLKSGNVIQYYQGGVIQTISKFKKGKINGEFKSFYSDGSIHQVTNFSNDVRSGSFEEFHRNGSFKSCSNYYLGIKVGKSYDFFKSGGVAVYNN